jgi:hypothetical protein
MIIRDATIVPLVIIGMIPIILLLLVLTMQGTSIEGGVRGYLNVCRVHAAVRLALNRPHKDITISANEGAPLRPGIIPTVAEERNLPLLCLIVTARLIFPGSN